MDPDATLTEIRNLLNEVNHATVTDEHAALAQLVGDLDVWITRSGGLPNDWWR